MIGRKTNGGFVITSSPLRPPPFTVSATGEALGVGLGEGEGLATAEGDGTAGGVGVGGPCKLKPAHGPGATLAHRRCTPGPSPGKGVTTLVKPPPESAWTSATTLDAESQ